MFEKHKSLFNKTKIEGDDPFVQADDHEYLFIDEEYEKWYYYLGFLYFWILYFGITMTEHPPADEFDVNMLEGCHNGWFG
jgi:hypothetical protein